MPYETQKDILLELKDYSITFKTPDGEVKAVSNMLSRLKASDNLFNTSSFQPNAAIFIQFQMGKVRFDGRYRL